VLTVPHAGHVAAEAVSGGGGEGEGGGGEGDGGDGEGGGGEGEGGEGEGGGGEGGGEATAVETASTTIESPLKPRPRCATTPFVWPVAITSSAKPTHAVCSPSDESANSMLLDCDPEPVTLAPV